jgi:osmotically inducible protein OsmC
MFNTATLRPIVSVSRRALSAGWTNKYTATCTSVGGRIGSSKSSDGNIDIKLTTPKGLGGPETPGTTNPEQLFASGYAACFIGAMGVHAQKILGEKLPPTVSVKADVSILAKEGEGFKLAVKLTGKIPGVSKDKVSQVMTEAHKTCPYSKAVKGNVDVELAATE